MKGYFVKNTVADGNLQCYVFTDLQAFSQVCGTASTMSSKPDVPDFTNNLVIAIAGKSTNRPSTIKLAGTTLENGILAMSNDEEAGDEELTYTMRPLIVVSVGKTSIKRVVFRQGTQEIYSVDYGMI